MSPRLSNSLLAPLSALLLAACSSHHGADRWGAVVSKADQDSMTPADVLADLKAGHQRFLDDQLILRDYPAQVRATASGQHPKAIVVGCLDSRVPPEVVFDQGIGDVFVGRVAGNFENVDLLGSLEFGARLAGSKVIVVLGHSSCGAIKGAADGAEMGNLTATLANLAPALEAARARVPGTHDSGNKAYIDAAVEENVRITCADILSRSPVLAGMVEAGELMVVGGVYDLATGKVRWLDG